MERIESMLRNVNGVFIRDETYEDRKHRAKREMMLQQKAESRATECWCADCDRTPQVWVHSVEYHVADRTRAEVTSDDYPGPVPGFCFAHISTGPELLAETVYEDRPEMSWGFRPQGYTVIFTDGTKHGGDVVDLRLDLSLPVVTDTHIRGDSTL